jgi:hypothetical protein
MKKAELFFFTVVLFAMIFIFACSKKGPAEPGQDTPTVTMTSCVACTSTDTPTITETCTITMTNTVTPTITVTTVSSYYNFEAGTLDGWAAGSWGVASNCAATSAGIVSAPTTCTTTGPKALKLDYSLTSVCDTAVVILTLSQPGYLVGKAIVAHIWVPASLIGTGTQYGVNIGLTGNLGEQSGTALLFTAGDAGKWRMISWSPSLVGEDAVTKITIMIGKAVPAAPDTSGSVYIDDVVWF